MYIWDDELRICIIRYSSSYGTTYGLFVNTLWYYSDDKFSMLLIKYYFLGTILLNYKVLVYKSRLLLFKYWSDSPIFSYSRLAVT